jgi:preprotein translocase subunit Sss1
MAKLLKKYKSLFLTVMCAFLLCAAQCTPRMVYAETTGSDTSGETCGTSGSFAGACFNSEGKIVFNYNAKNYSDGVSLNKTNIIQKSTGAVDALKTFVYFLEAVIILVLVAYFIVNVVRLGAAGDNPAKRQESITQLIYVLIGIAVVGGIGVITYMMYHFIA